MLSLQREQNDTSKLLDLLRAAGAQMVCVGHAMVYFHVARPVSLPLPQNVGVLMFFVLSGFLITGTLVQKSEQPGYGFGRYFVDRFARIYSGLVPALAFIVIVDGVTILLTGEQLISRYYNPETLAANLALLPGYHGIFDQSYLQWSPFGSASPLWTLGIEWQIYMFVGATYFIAIKPSRWWLLLVPIALFLGQTSIHYLGGALSTGATGTGLFSLWVAGGALYFLLSRYVPPASFSLALMAAASIAYATFLKTGHEYDMRTYPALVVMIGAAIAASQRTKLLRESKALCALADSSFTLYLIHHTIIVAIVTIHPAAAGWAWLIGAVALSNVLALLIALPFEMRHKQFAAWLVAIAATKRRAGRVSETA